MQPKPINFASLNKLRDHLHRVNMDGMSAWLELVDAESYLHAHERSDMSAKLSQILALSREISTELDKIYKENSGKVNPSDPS